MAQSLIRGSTQILSGSITADRFVAGLALPTSQLAEGSLFIKSSGTVAMAAALAMGGFQINNVGAPTASNDAATKTYVDSLVNGLTMHPFCRVVSTSNTAITGLLTIDGITVVDGDRILATAQTTQSQNGPWIAHSGSWTRPVDWAAASTVKEGAYFWIDPDGTTYKNTKWFCTNTGTIIVDTTSATFVQDLSGTTYTNGNGIALAGNVFSINLGTNPGLSITSGLQAVGNATNLITVGASGIGISASSSNGQLIVGNGSNVPTWTTLSGDVSSVSAAGSVTINNTAGTGFVKYGNFISNETPAGSVNSSNTAFTLANTPQVGSQELFLNGQLLEPGSGNDYTISSAAITMLFVPQTGDKLRAYYVK